MTREELVPEQVAKTFWQQGYIHLPAFFDSELMNHLDKRIEKHFGAQPDFSHTDEFVSLSATEVVPWFPQREGVTDFDSVEEDPFFKELTEAILDKGWGRQYCMVMFSKEGTVGQAWHQDCPPETGMFNLNRLVYTRDLTAENGGEVVVMPGSHREGVLPAGDPHEDLTGQVVLTPKRGDLVLLHGHCWHRILPIRKGYRFSTNYRSAGAGTPEDITDVCVYRNMRYRFSTEEVLEHRTA